MADTPLNLHALALDAIQQLDFSNPGWARAMEGIIARAHTAAAIAAIADRAGVKPSEGLFRGLSRIERAEIKAIVSAQLAYLKGFVAAAPNLSEAQTAARAALYAGAVRKTFYQVRWGDWEIPPYLLPGNQACMANCGCSISVGADSKDSDTGTLTRVMGKPEKHCTECPALVGSYDVKRKRLE